MKKSILSFLLIGMLLVSVTGCGAKSGAEEAFSTMMQILQTGEIETIGGYYNFDEISRFLDAEKQQELLTVVFQTLKEMEYQIESVEKINGANVKVSAKIKILDFSQVMERYLEAVMAMTANPQYQAKLPTIKAEEYQNMLADAMAEILADPDIPKVSQTVEITMVKQNGKWMPGGDKNEFFGVLFGNLMDAVNSLL